MTKLPHAADAYGKGLQRTPSLESLVVTTAVMAGIIRLIAATAQSKYHTSKQANIDDDSRTTKEAEAAAAAAAVLEAARAPSPQTNGRRMAKRGTGENGYRKQGKQHLAD